MRDVAVHACSTFLQKYGDLYQYQPGDLDDPTDFFHHAKIHLPLLVEPATPEDIEQNRAIFALQGQTRVWKMPEFPMTAKWTTLKDVLREQQFASLNGTSGVNLIYDNEDSEAA